MSECHEIVVIIRPSFKRFCGQDACQAALFNHLLYWIAKKAKGQSEDDIKSGHAYWYGSIEDEIYKGLAESWGISKIKKELRELVRAGLIGQRRNPMKGWDRTYHYFFGEEQGNVMKNACERYAINLEQLGLTSEVLHLLFITNATGKSNQCIGYIQPMEEMDSTDATGKSNRAIPKVSTKDSPKDSNKEEESALPLHPMWSLWMASIRRPAKNAPIERDLNYCQELEEMCKEAKIELTIELIHKVRDQFKQANTDKKGWFLGNLVTELREYLDQIQPAQPEMPELTEEERDEKVLWTEKPSAARRLFARSATMQEHLADQYCKPHWMPRRAAREYDYDMPGVQHYTLAQQAEYEQLTSLPELARAG